MGKENVFYDILEEKKRLSWLYKQEVQKDEKLTFFQRVLVQKWPFFQLSLKAIKGRKMAFTIF